MRCEGCILVVDDDADLREALREHIERLGCRVVLATDGVDALGRLNRSLPAQPCAIVADLNMPNMGGVVLMERVRADDRHAATPVITMSAEPARERPPHVELHLTKPFVTRVLDAAVAGLCRCGPARYRGTGRPEPVDTERPDDSGSHPLP